MVPSMRATCRSAPLNTSEEVKLNGTAAHRQCASWGSLGPSLRRKPGPNCTPLSNRQARPIRGCR